MKETRLYGVARKNKREVKRFVKFAIVGGAGLILDYAVLNVLARWFKVWEPIAVAVAFTCAATSNYIWNRLWVYPETRNTLKRKQMPVFIGVNIIGLGINWIVLYLLYGPLTALFNNNFWGLNVTKGIGALIVMMWNFLVNRFVTFGNVSRARSEIEAGPLDSAL